VAKKLFLKEFPKIILKTPIIPASLIGITFAYYNLTFPDTVVTLFSWIGDTAPPLSLFTLGLSLAQDKISFQRGKFREEIMVFIALKNFALPATAFCLGKYVFDLPPFWLLTATLIAAMPAPRNASLFSQRYGLDVKKANTLIVLTTLVSFLVINILMVLFSIES
jgi:predicted permease